MFAIYFKSKFLLIFVYFLTSLFLCSKIKFIFISFKLFEFESMEREGGVRTLGEELMRQVESTFNLNQYLGIQSVVNRGDEYEFELGTEEKRGEEIYKNQKKL